MSAQEAAEAVAKIKDEIEKYKKELKKVK